MQVPDSLKTAGLTASRHWEGRQLPPFSAFRQGR